MKTKEWIGREKYVALHAQPLWLRLIKFPIIIAIGWGLYTWKGWMGVVAVIAFCIIAGTILHFILRWKTKGWTQSWGPYKKIELPQ